MNNEKNDKETLEMPKKKENLNDTGTQELVEKKENDQSKKNKTLKKIIMTIIIIIIILLLIIGCCTSKGPHFWMNIDINKDEIPEVNLDVDDDGKCDANCSK